ncbi:MAG: gliding motility-associated C-terminal domain-containing protein [Bacteroidetes bacterium]|nr:gliding motility-associated C-terminal domain-containing protein [Bacteroidota bacterium]
MRRTLTGCILFLIFHGALFAQQVSTVAGLAGLTGSANGTGSSARFNEPHGLTADKNGNIYIADRINNLIRKITPSGTVSTFAGTGAIGATDGPALTASFNEPWDIACDTLGNFYIADTKNYKIRKIDASGNVTTLAGTGVFGTSNGPGATARFGTPAGIAVTRDGQKIYVSDYNTHTIRLIDAGQVFTLAGTVFLSGSVDGSGTAASFNHPFGLSLNASGDLLIADEWNHKIRKMTPAGVVSTIAGDGNLGTTDGTPLTARFNFPVDVASDTIGNIFITDGQNHTIRKFSSQSGQVTTYAGYAGQPGAVDGNGSLARFKNPAGIVYNRANRALYIGDNGNNTIRKIVFTSSVTLTVALTGSPTVCAGTPVTFTVTPSGLSNYSITENGNILGSSTTSSVILNSLTPGSHTLQATAIDAGGATAFSNTLSLTVLPAFVPVVSSNGGTAICNGASLTLTAQSGSNYLWSGGQTTSSIVVSSAGSYSVSVTNGSGCRGTSQPFVVTVQASPTAVITALTDTVCPGATTTLTAAAANTWLWSNGATTQAINVGAGNYSVTVSGAGGCTATSQPMPISSYVVNTPVVNPSGSVNILQGDSILLQASGRLSYVWSTGATGSSIYVSATGNYSVVTTASNGCTSTSAIVQVTIISSSTILTAQGVTSFCDGGSVVLSSIFSSGNQWFYEGMPLPGETAQQYTARDSGWYYVGVWLNNSWMYSDSVLIKVYSAPEVPIANDTVACKGSSIVLSPVIVSGVSYRWYDSAFNGTLLYSGTQFPTPPIIANTTYYVEAVSINGCPSAGRMNLNVSLFDIPKAAFTYSVTTQSGLYTANFSCTAVNPYSVTWIFGDTTVAGNVSYSNDTLFTYSTAGTYEVILITSNALGCTDTLIKKVYIGAKYPAFVPTTFTPNEDGKNDIFRVRGEQITLQEMKIYDQWGTLIYTTDSALPQWDGRVNGKVVPNGTYVYRIVILDADNISKEMTGPVTVIK